MGLVQDPMSAHSTHLHAGDTHMDYAKETREFIVDNFLYGDASALDDNKSFLDNGIVDSTGMLELISFLEHTFHVTIEPEEMVPENLDSVHRIETFLVRKLTPVTPSLDTASYGKEPVLRNAAPD